jgi:pyruvate/2-oxoglutarate dehydrogenase complex dihydrolipoamide acyltransferase (E2) component
VARQCGHLTLTNGRTRRYKPAMPLVPLTLADLDLGEVPVRACSWLAEQGARVMQGDRLLEIVVGEVTIDLEAPASGRLTRRCVGPDEVIAIGQVLAVIAAND